MADENMASSPFDCVKKSEQITPKNTSIVFRDYLNEDSTLWSVPRKEVVRLQIASIRNFFNSKWALWYMAEEDEVRSWYNRLQFVVRIKSIEEFWALYAYLLRPYELPTTSAYCFFKDGIEPLWTHKSNLKGGQWAISIQKHHDQLINGKLDHVKKISKYWKSLLIAIAGEQFKGYAKVVCGAVVTIDEGEDKVALWISDVSQDKCAEIGCLFKQILKLPNDGDVRYQCHPLNMSPVLKIIGLSQVDFNCNRVFNLLCLYGDCLKVLFSKDGTCTIQMRTGEQAESVINHLSGCNVFGKEIRFVSMIRKEIEKPAKGCLFKMANNSCSFADFSGDSNLRFDRSKSAWGSLAQKPTNSLRFFNAPPRMTTTRIRKIFENHNIRPKQSSVQEKNQLSCSGIVIFSTVEEAMKALILCNHTTIVEPYQKNPYIFQLCFS